MKLVQRPEMLNRKRENGAWDEALVILCALLAALLLFELWFSRTFFVVEISGNSMQNTVFDGNILYADRERTAERGDIVVIDVRPYKKQDGFSGDYIIKRLIGTEGDTVKYENGNVWLKRAGETEFVSLEEPYAKGVTAPFEETAVGEGEIFFLGDNREVSKDSRIVGCYRAADIMGVVPDWAVSFKGLIKAWESFRSLFGQKIAVEE